MSFFFTIGKIILVILSAYIAYETKPTKESFLIWYNRNNKKGYFESPNKASSSITNWFNKISKNILRSPFKETNVEFEFIDCTVLLIAVVIVDDCKPCYFVGLFGQWIEIYPDFLSCFSIRFTNDLMGKANSNKIVKMSTKENALFPPPGKDNWEKLEQTAIKYKGKKEYEKAACLFKKGAKLIEQSETNDKFMLFQCASLHIECSKCLKMLHYQDSEKHSKEAEAMQEIEIAATIYQKIKKYSLAGRYFENCAIYFFNTVNNNKFDEKTSYKKSVANYLKAYECFDTEDDERKWSIQYELGKVYCQSGEYLPAYHKLLPLINQWRENEALKFNIPQVVMLSFFCLVALNDIPASFELLQDVPQEFSKHSMNIYLCIVNKDARLLKSTINSYEEVHSQPPDWIRKLTIFTTDSDCNFEKQHQFGDTIKNSINDIDLC